MTLTQQFDLSKLKIPREHKKEDEGPSRSRFWIPMYAFGIIAMGLALFFFIRTLSPDEIVEVTTASYISPDQAGALLTASGYVVAQRKASIASKATGRLVSLSYEEGDQVKKGQIIARIESADVEASLAQAKANLEVVEAEKNDAEQSLRRANKLLENELISQAELDAAQTRHDRVVASISAAEAALKSAEVQVENTRIRAPFNGTILTKNADVGEVVAPFAAGASSRVAVVTIADMSSLEVEADVSESNIEKITIKQPCEIVLDAYPDHRYKGYVNKIVPTADRAKATVLTKIRFRERDNRVLPEMSAKVYFLSKSTTDTTTQKILAIQITALTKRRNENVVFLLRDKNIVAETPVETGKSYGSLVEIKKGLTIGDKVILKPPESLQSGVRVKLK